VISMRATLFLVCVALLLFGCISGEERHNVASDGTDNVEVELYKTGLLANADCKSFKGTLRTFMINASKEQLEKLENLPCRETDSSIIINYFTRLGENESRITIREHDGKTYYRFEEKSGNNTIGNTTISNFKIIVKMPNKITEHNGKLIDDRTVEFEVGQDRTIYVECEKPALSICPVPLMVLLGGAVVGLAFLRRDSEAKKDKYAGE